MQHGALVEDEANAAVVRVGDVHGVGQTQERHHQAIGDLDAVRRHVAEDGDGHATFLGEAAHDLRKVEPFVEQADAAHRHERDLATFDRFERRRPGAQRARPVDAPLQAGPAGEQLGALGQAGPPDVFDGDGRRVHRSGLRSVPGTG